MKPPFQRKRSRIGFTLIETLIVIAIIVVLIAMLLPVIFGVRRKAKETETHNEIRQLSVAIQAFQTEYRVTYLPSYIILCENEGEYFSSTGVFKPGYEDSYHYLKRLWPRLTFPVDWNGNGSPNDPEAILLGDQCLVFFLGGIPIPPSSGNRGTQGFSTNPANPAQPGGSRRGPFFKFDESRLVELVGIHPPGFYSYQDPYRNTPKPFGPDRVFGVYAYFSAYGRTNGYKNDCNLGVFPYADVHDQYKPHYLNPASFQIISPGADGRFGRGSPPEAWPTLAWTPSTANSSLALESFFGSPPYRVGADDISNFYDRPLGASE